MTDGELQIHLEVGRESVRHSISQALQERLKGVFAWTRELGVPVLPLSTAEDTAQQLRHLHQSLVPPHELGHLQRQVPRERIQRPQRRKLDPQINLRDLKDTLRRLQVA